MLFVSPIAAQETSGKTALVNDSRELTTENDFRYFPLKKGSVFEYSYIKTEIKTEISLDLPNFGNAVNRWEKILDKKRITLRINGVSQKQNGTLSADAEMEIKDDSGQLLQTRKFTITRNNEAVVSADPFMRGKPRIELLFPARKASNWCENPEEYFKSGTDPLDEKQPRCTDLTHRTSMLICHETPFGQLCGISAQTRYGCRNHAKDGEFGDRFYVQDIGLVSEYLETRAGEYPASGNTVIETLFTEYLELESFR